MFFPRSSEVSVKKTPSPVIRTALFQGRHLELSTWQGLTNTGSDDEGDTQPEHRLYTASHFLPSPQESMYYKQAHMNGGEKRKYKKF